SGLQWEHRRWDGYPAYSDSKLFDAVLAAAVARRWPDVISSSVDPGWVRTKMGGPGAPGEIGPGAETQAWLATSNDPLARQSGRYFHTEDCARRTPPSATPSSKTAYSPRAMSSPARRSPTRRGQCM